MTTTTTTTGASTQLAPAALSVPGGPYDGRPWATYERISKTRSGRVRAGDGIGGRVGEDAQHATVDLARYQRALDALAWAQRGTRCTSLAPTSVHCGSCATPLQTGN